MKRTAGFICGFSLTADFCLEDRTMRFDDNALLERLNTNPSLRARNPGLLVETGLVLSSAPAVKTPDELRVEAEAMLEGELQNYLRKEALKAGWLYYHTHDSRKSDEGFPDTVLIRITINAAELLFVECKRETEDPTKDQEKWLAAIHVLSERLSGLIGLLMLTESPLSSMVCVEQFCWRPSQWLSGEIQQRLSKSIP